jgi:hypothetical protein
MTNRTQHRYKPHIGNYMNKLPRFLGVIEILHRYLLIMWSHTFHASLEQSNLVLFFDMGLLLQATGHTGPFCLARTVSYWAYPGTALYRVEFHKVYIIKGE